MDSLGCKLSLLGATIVAGGSALSAGDAAATNPPLPGVYLMVNPFAANNVNFMTGNKDLFGPPSCSTTACIGGITGVFLRVAWSDFQSVTVSGSTTYTLNTDPHAKIAALLNAMSQVEQDVQSRGSLYSGWKLSLSVGLGAGSSAAFDALQFRAVAPTGTTTTLSVQGTLTCDFPTSGGTISGNGGFSQLVGFPTQCVLKNTPNATQPSCIPQPDIWGNQSTYINANATYLNAYMSALTALINEVTTGTNSHAITSIKLSGINQDDIEIGVPGNPTLNAPRSNGTTYYCGYSGAQDAEQIWTNQNVGGLALYVSSRMEDTWTSLLGSYSASFGALHPYYMIDVYGEHNFPPVGPRHCGDTGNGTICTYTAGNSSDVPMLSTGEMDYLIRAAVSRFGASSVAVQDQGLTDTRPSYTPPTVNYDTLQIPCAMQSDARTLIGYQTITGTSLTGSTYLNTLANGVTYGGSYEELTQDQLKSYLASGSKHDFSATISATVLPGLQANFATESAGGSAVCPLAPGDAFNTFP